MSVVLFLLVGVAVLGIVQFILWFTICRYQEPILKMKPEHYRQLVEAVDSVREEALDARGAYYLAGRPKIRFAWDLLHKSGLRPGDSVGAITGWPVYDYLDDNHITTALFKAMKDCDINY